MKMKREDVRNIAIAAHVDRDKTTLVSRLLRQSGVFRVSQEVQERVMDSNDLERERGITILSKNTAAFYKDTKINIIDTPGHTDFGSEVEYVLKMMGDVVLVVDVCGGPMPQTKFVLQKALDLSLSIIVCINKVDRPEARPGDVIDETLEFMMDLNAADEQLDCPFICASARGEFIKYKVEDPEADMNPLFETIINHIPAPEEDPGAETQVLISAIDYNKFVDRIGIGRVGSGGPKANQGCALVNRHEPDKLKKIKIGKLYEFNNLKRVEVQEMGIGSIVAISDIADIHISDIIYTPNNPESIPFQEISGPTIATYFMINGSPLMSQEGKYITSRHLRGRPFRELSTDVSLRAEGIDSTNYFKVSGRGELHLSVLIENMYREGFEFAVNEAEILHKYNERNHELEPMELVYVDVLEEYAGVVVQKLTSHKGALQGVSQAAGGYSRLEFPIPSRGLIGYRGDFMADTEGNGILNTISDGYSEYKDNLFYRQTDSPVAFEAGEAITYDLFNAQERSTLFIGPGVKVYPGMVVGQGPKAENIEINVYKTKKLTNTRSSSANEALKLAPPKIMSLEQALDFIDADELLEATLESLRVRKKILGPTLRKRASFKNK